MVGGPAIGQNDALGSAMLPGDGLNIKNDNALY